MHGVDILANAVKVTLGPKGRNVVLEVFSKTIKWNHFCIPFVLYALCYI